LFALLLSIGCSTRQVPAPQSAGKLAPNTTDLVSQGQRAAERGDAVRAEQYLSLAIEQGAERRVVMPILLQACLESSHLRAALNHAEPYLLEHPGDDALRYLVANLHLGLDQVAPARRELELLLQRNPDDPDAHYLLGILDVEVDTESAREHLLSAAKHTKDRAQRIEVTSRLAQLRLRKSVAAVPLRAEEQRQP
jgi:thioredoxin-like negative regulator of GroEL